MAGHRDVVTAEGKARLERELEQLRERLPDLLQRLRKAREVALGDASELSDHDEAQGELERLKARIAELEAILAEAEVVSPSRGGGVVAPGSTVVVQEQHTRERYTLVGSAEADPLMGRISLESPVGQALLGRRPGETVDVETPSGRRRLEIVALVHA